MDELTDKAYDALVANDFLVPDEAGTATRRRLVENEEGRGHKEIFVDADGRWGAR